MKAQGPAEARSGEGVHGSRPVRLLCILGGAAALGLGLLGVFLPVLPTTPFILLAAACFARGSDSLHRWMLAHPVAGPLIRAWREHRAMPRRAKGYAYLLMALSFGSSILLVPSIWHRLMLALVGCVLLLFLWRVPVRD